jgi:hypothetical protein
MMILPATIIVLVLLPSLNADGQKAYSTRGQQFDGKVDGRRIVKRSTANSYSSPVFARINIPSGDFRMLWD